MSVPRRDLISALADAEAETSGLQSNSAGGSGAASAGVLGAVLSSTAITAGGLLLAMMFGAVRQVIAGRALGPEGFGVIGVAESFENVLIRVAPLGLTTSIPLLLTHALAKDERKDAGQIVATSAAIGAALVLVAGGVMIIFGDELAGLINADGAGPVLRLWGFVVIGLGLCQVAASVLRGFLMMAASAIVRDVLPNALLLVGLVLALATGMSLPNLALGYVGGAIVAGLAATLLVRRAALRRVGSLAISGSHAKPLLALSLPVITMVLSGQLIRQINVPILSTATDLATVGIFSSALFLASTIEAVFTSLTMVYMPYASKVLAEDGDRSLGAMQSVVGRWTFVLSLIPVILVAMLAEPVLGLLFGAEYLPAAQPLRLILLGLLVQALIGPRNSVLLALGHARAVTLNFGLSLGLAIIVSVALIPSLGIIGAALSFMAAFVLRSAISERQLARILPGSGVRRRDAIGLLAVVGVAVSAVAPAGPLQWIAPLVGGGAALLLLPGTAEPIDKQLIDSLRARLFRWPQRPNHP